MLNVLIEANRMSTYNMHVKDKIRKNNPRIPLNICFFELSAEFSRD